MNFVCASSTPTPGCAIDLEVEQALAEISALMIKPGWDDFDARVDWTLERIGRLTEADRSYLFAITSDGSTATNTHEFRPRHPSLKSGMDPRPAGSCRISLMPRNSGRRTAPCSKRTSRFETSNTGYLDIRRRTLVQRVNGQPPVRAVRGRLRRLSQHRTRHITERKRVEERLLFMNALLSAQYAASMEGMLVVGEQGKILPHSIGVLHEIWGIPRTSILAKRVPTSMLRYVLDELMIRQ